MVETALKIAQQMGWKAPDNDTHIRACEKSKRVYLKQGDHHFGIVEFKGTNQALVWGPHGGLPTPVPVVPA